MQHANPAADRSLSPLAQSRKANAFLEVFEAMKSLSDSWNAFSPEVAAQYLKTYGHPSVSSKALLVDVLRQYTANAKVPKVIDLGCGNAQLGEYFIEKDFRCDYTGVDFADVLLDAGRKALPSSQFIKDDVNTLTRVSGEYDVALYSHVVELLSAPEDSLSAARRLSDLVVIRFYEPPEFESDVVEMLWMDVGAEKSVPFLRRKMSRDYYQLVLSRIGCKRVDVYRDTSKDQVHVLTF
jgi:ubiquinone/menaquinone biosynthesis C-methylase UbiE